MRNGYLLVISTVLVSTCVCLANAASNAVTSDESSPQPFSRLGKDYLMYLEETANIVTTAKDPPSHESGFKTMRGLKTQLLLKLLDQIDMQRDRNFNFEDHATFNVAPPRFSGDSGVVPSAIHDPKARREYEDAIRKNSEKAARYNFQLYLKGLDERVTPLAVQYIASAYDRTPEDSNELMGYLGTLLSKDARKMQMKKDLHELLDLPQEPHK